MRSTLLRDFALGVTWCAALILLADHAPRLIVALATITGTVALLIASNREVENRGR